MTDTSKFMELIQGYIENSLTEQEEEELFAMIQQPEYNNLLEEAVEARLNLPQTAGPSINKDRLEQITQKILGTKQPAKIISIRRFSRVAAAAVIVLMISVGGYFYFNKEGLRQAQPDNTAQRFKNDVAAPGKAKAMITLADGRTVAL